MIKYPKTPRTWEPSLNDWVTVEEKLDGANVGAYFEDGQLVLHSRGHILRGGPREALFERYKAWGYSHQHVLQDVLGSRFRLYCEWLWAKHRVYYDALPSWVIGLDILDTETGKFLARARREAMFAAIGIPAAPLLWDGPCRNLGDPSRFIVTSSFKTRHWRDNLIEAYPDFDWEGTEDSDLMEGVYLRVETDHVEQRMKRPRPEFEKIRDADSDWTRRKFIVNGVVA